MTVAAAVQLDGVEPLLLALVRHRHAVAFGARAREQALVRNLEHGEPIDGGIVFRRGRRIRRRHRRQVHDLAARALDLRRIDEPVAAHPHAVGGLRQIGDHVAPLIIRDHDLGESGAQLGRLRDHPDAGFRSILAGDDPADVVVVDLHRDAWRLVEQTAGSPARRPTTQRGRPPRRPRTAGVSSACLPPPRISARGAPRQPLDARTMCPNRGPVKRRPRGQRALVDDCGHPVNR